MARALPAPGVTVDVTPERATITVDRPLKIFQVRDWVVPLGCILLVAPWSWSIAKEVERSQGVPLHLLPQIVACALLGWLAWAMVNGIIRHVTTRMTFLITAGYFEVTSDRSLPRPHRRTFSHPRSH